MGLGFLCECRPVIKMCALKKSGEFGWCFLEDIACYAWSNENREGITHMRFAELWLRDKDM